jgi:F0F1-type ATP synthase epsilon subunit
MSKSSKNTQLTVKARAPFNIYYEGTAKSVSGANAVGKFDVLPGHADFFSVMIPGDVVIETDKEPVVFPVSSGIITVRNDEVMLFVNI